MLANQMADHDMVGRWMSQHLAELVIAADDDSTTTVEQRLEIVDTILRIWAHRGSLPRPAPLEDFSCVLAGLDRLGDDSPWRFLRLFEENVHPPELTESTPSLAVTATDLERLTRETVLHLLWRTAQNATDQHQEWLRVADQIQSTVETDVTNALYSHSHRHRRAAAIRRAMSDADDEAEEDSAEDHFSDASQARLLRDMARRLDTIADEILRQGPQVQSEDAATRTGPRSTQGWDRQPGRP